MIVSDEKVEKQYIRCESCGVTFAYGYKVGITNEDIYCEVCESVLDEDIKNHNKELRNG